METLIVIISHVCNEFFKTINKGEMKSKVETKSEFIQVEIELKPSRRNHLSLENGKLILHPEIVHNGFGKKRLVLSRGNEEIMDSEEGSKLPQINKEFMLHFINLYNNGIFLTNSVIEVTETIEVKRSYRTFIAI